MTGATRNIWRDIGLARAGDAAARARVEQNAAENWPGARWGPLDEPPIGKRVRFPVVLGGGTGTVIGLHRERPDGRLHDCPGCQHALPRPQRWDGWWSVRLDGNDDEDAVPAYPPSLVEESR